MTGTRLNQSSTLPDYFALHGRWRGDRLAVRCGDHDLTWKQFVGRLNRFSNGIRAVGLEQGAVIAILADNRLETVEIMMGSICSGMVAAPLSLAIGDDAIFAQIVDSGAQAVFATSREAERIQALRGREGFPDLPCFIVGAKLPGWKEYEPWRDAQGDEPASIEIRPEDPCTLAYSSGTTGVPKGILHDHEARLNFATDLAASLRFHEETVSVCSIGLYSNAMWFSMLGSLVLGGTVVVLPRFEAGKFLAYVERYGITHAFLVPLQYEQLLATACAFEGSTLEVLVTAGAPMPRLIKARVRERFGCQLFELYGLTEGFATTLQPAEGLRFPETVGRPIPGSDMKIICDDGALARAGELGEIVGRSRMMMKGYFGKPKLSQEVFIHDEHGNAWLRTGDVGRINESGYLEVVGRTKDMILSGGANIYPSDIEAIAKLHKDVSAVAVVGVPDEKWGETPIAFVVTPSGSGCDTEAMRKWVNDRLGAYQKLSAVVLCDDLPRNTMGKVLRPELQRRFADLVAKGLA